MEVDDENVTAGLLEQMSCLQTLDHDDLVSQMLRLVGSESLTPATASFYLEMNGWNVQAAVCAYFDLEAGPEAKQAAPGMTFIKDVTIGEGEAVPPDNLFVKTWQVQNTGAEVWPEGVMLRHTQGRLMTADGRDRVAVQTLMPWQMADLSIEMRSPNEPGIFESKWRMSTAAGIFFGDTIWVIITVERSGTLAVTQQMNNFNALGGLPQGYSSDSVTTPRTLVNPFSPRKSGENHHHQLERGDEDHGKNHRHYKEGGDDEMNQ